jgi:hypothetical protein
MKYVIIRKMGLEMAILFPDQVEHVEAVNLFLGKPVAAGFCSLKVEERDGAAEVRAWGRSSSLGLESRPEIDADAIQFSWHMMQQVSLVEETA